MDAAWEHKSPEEAAAAHDEKATQHQRKEGAAAAAAGAAAQPESLPAGFASFETNPTVAAPSTVDFLSASAFDTFARAPGAAATYATPFDSPDPVVTVAVNTEGSNPFSSNVLQVEQDTEERPTMQRMRAKSYTATSSSSASGFDAQSIFHADHHSKKAHKAARRSATERKSSTPQSLTLDTSSLRPATAAAMSTTQAIKEEEDENDVLAHAVIPDILSARAVQSRRASEPIALLGSRRAAEAARAAAAAAAKQRGATPTSASSSQASASATSIALPNGGVNRRLSIDIDVEKLDTAKASSVNLDPLCRGSPVTPRVECGVAGCSEALFASGCCALHLTEKFQPATPTTVIRALHSLWSQTVSEGVGHAKSKLQIKWAFWKKGSYYEVLLWEDREDGERTIFVNGKVNYRSHPEPGFFKLSMVLGRSKSSAFEVLCEATPRLGMQGATHARARAPLALYNYPGPYDFDLWIDGFQFQEAHNNFMSELGVAQQVAMQAAEDERDRLQQQQQQQQQAEGGANAGGVASAQAEARASEAAPAQSRSALKAAHYDALHYIRTHWGRSVSHARTRMGYPKNIVEWRFTLGGPAHAHKLVLVHSEKSGKRSITLDDKCLYVHKPNWINGLLLKRSSTHKLQIEAVNIEVRLQKLDYSQLSKSDSSSSSSSSSSSASLPAFAYDLIVGGVAFAQCTKTLLEYAGGMVDVEAKLHEQQAKAERKQRREREIKRDPRVQLSPE